QEVYIATFSTKPVSVFFYPHFSLSVYHCVSPSPQGRTELHDAAERGDVEAVERLLSTSVNINSRTEDEGDTALLLASHRGHVEVVRLLLKAGAAVFIPDKCCRTPLYWASFYGHRAVVELLLENGADVSICSEDGFSPLYVASGKGHSDVVDILLEAGADVHQATTKSGSVPLGIAAQEGHTETVQRLFGGRSQRQPTEQGRTTGMSASHTQLAAHEAPTTLIIIIIIITCQ
ncbi:Kinase D-interacting substrate of 220 kDa, partial [Geodia barretti]